MTVTATDVDASPSGPERLIALPLPAIPRHEPAVRTQPGDPTDDAAREALEVALAGIRHALQVEGIPGTLRDLLQHWEQEGLEFLR